MINSKFPLSEKYLEFLEKYEKTDIHFTLLEGTTDAYRRDALARIEEMEMLSEVLETFTRDGRSKSRKEGRKGCIA